MSDWKEFEGGKTIGAVGKERGIILKEEVHSGGARITLEEGGSYPFSISVEIDAVLFHTNNYRGVIEAETDYIWYKVIIEEILRLYEVEPELRDEFWNEERYQLVDQLMMR